MPQLLINIDVPDLERAVSFYVSAFGFTEARRFGNLAVELVGAQAPIYLLLKAPKTDAFPGDARQRDYRRHWTPVHFDFAVENLEASIERAVLAGAQPEGDVETHAWGRIAVLSDPFGHGFCLIQLKDRGYDEIAT